MKLSISRLAICLAVGSTIAASAFGQSKANQTQGYGNNQLLTFTYTQSFDCVDQPGSDLDFNGKKAQSDPGEMQTPICQVGTQPTINPPGKAGDPQVTTAPIYVLVPMFSSDNDQNPNDAISCSGVVSGTICGPTLGSTLISLFGALPEAFKAKPSVFTQCPEAGTAPGTCTMHAARLDLGPALVALGYLPPPTANVFVPSPNHSHVLKNSDVNLPAIWWQVLPVLVLNQSDWPSKDGTSGLTTVSAITSAINSGRAVEAPSNFFLFFSSHAQGGSSAHDQMTMVH
jgi:hypothetical protein